LEHFSKSTYAGQHHYKPRLLQRIEGELKATSDEERGRLFAMNAELAHMDGGVACIFKEACCKIICIVFR